ncbi:MAG: TlpA family protein disulfide reductase [Clostridia bacterium]|nr:TlpA family protein disulfide reductase [Clostridia bacterium]
MTIFKRGLCALLILMLACGLALAEEEIPDEANLIPDFTLEDQYGNSHTLSEYKGQIVLLNFWTTWCPYCVQEMPDFEALYHELGENAEEVVFLGIDAPPQDGNDAETINAFLAEKGFTYPSLIDSDGAVFQTFGIQAFPTTFVFTASGEILGYVPGALTRDNILQLIQMARDAEAEEAPEEAETVEESAQ